MIEEESFPLWGEFFLVHSFGLHLLRFPPCVGRGFCEGKERPSEGVSFSLCTGKGFPASIGILLCYLMFSPYGEMLSRRKPRRSHFLRASQYGRRFLAPITPAASEAIRRPRAVTEE